jgi:hypothetical protein
VTEMKTVAKLRLAYDEAFTLHGPFIPEALSAVDKDTTCWDSAVPNACSDTRHSRTNRKSYRGKGQEA